MGFLPGGSLPPAGTYHLQGATLMKRLERFTKRISALFNWVALAALTIMLVIVSADIAGAKFFNKPFPGAMDVVSLLGLLLIGFSVSQTYLMGRHIKVDFISILLPAPVRKIIQSLSIGLCILFFTAAVWRLFLYARYFQTHGESSLTVNVPLAPFAYALGVAFIPMITALFIQLYRVWKGPEG